MAEPKILQVSRHKPTKYHYSSTLIAPAKRKEEKKEIGDFGEMVLVLIDDPYIIYPPSLTNKRAFYTS